MRLRLLGWLTGLAVSAALLVPTAALATETETIHFSDTLIVSRPDPCTGASATVTLTFKGVMHITTLDNGSYHVMTMDVGTLTVVPDDPQQPTYSGHFTETGTENQTSKSFTTSFHRNVVLRGSDGSLVKEHVAFHITVNADGTVTSSIDTETHTCP
jgi:hypothetical protein